MEIGMLSVLAFGFLLGMKHAIEPDHVIAVSTIASQSKKLWRASLAGVFWGIGHTATLFVVGLLLMLVKNEIPETLAMSLEFCVGIMLVYLGLNALFKFGKKKVHAHTHVHGDEEHNHFHAHQHMATHDHQHPRISYLKSVVIGFIHGLAGSAAMMLLTLETVDSIWQAMSFILVFGLGTVLSMLLFTSVISIPFIASQSKPRFHTLLIRVTGGVSTVFGVYYMYGVGVSDGLFQLLLS
ncbi:urease accessory protein UreH [Tumebacillus algifaecis]|uniref:Urease accessory protein UreH n=1 Tax=Tumebacillus algifaecis TaxID=1214604 RepID=A0A223D0G5_9BACL|nr:sulfite exporter TauE/SafE family protein [Tumebacillus algifaecis]ASS74857.1 urease accessory protein UreH [Tumebacillus algifaecis]